MVITKNVSQLDHDWANEKEWWTNAGVKSSICFALEAQKQYFGHVCFEYACLEDAIMCKTPEPFNISLLKIIVGIIAIALERKQIEDHLERIAKYDIMTSLPNRYQFGLVIDQMIAYCLRHNTTLAVLSMDIDNFKKC